jgi:DNA-binding transcriptional regulator YhcF (GntR family)
MKVLFDNIIALKEVNTLTKHEQLVNGIINTIDAKALVKGDRLLSINNMVDEVGFARKTIVKAYEDLKSRGLVESKNFKGYYILNSNTKVKLKVALLLYAFHSFQEDFYNTFRKELEKKYHIDVFFHHNNLDIFKNIVNSISGKYGKYVIAPIQAPEVIKILKTFLPEKLLIIDRHVKMPKEYSNICQEFENSTYNNLVNLLPAIQQYEKFCLTASDGLTTALHELGYGLGLEHPFDSKKLDTYVIKEKGKKYQDDIQKEIKYLEGKDPNVGEIKRLENLKKEKEKKQ